MLWHQRNIYDANLPPLNETSIPKEFKMKSFIHFDLLQPIIFESIAIKNGFLSVSESNISYSMYTSSGKSTIERFL